MEERIVAFNFKRGKGSTNLQIRCNEKGQVNVSEDMGMRMVEEIFEGYPGIYERIVERITGQEIQ